MAEPINKLAALLVAVSTLTASAQIDVQPDILELNSTQDFELIQELEISSGLDPVEWQFNGTEHRKRYIASLKQHYNNETPLEDLVAFIPNYYAFDSEPLSLPANFLTSTNAPELYIAGNAFKTGFLTFEQSGTIGNYGGYEIAYITDGLYVCSASVSGNDSLEIEGVLANHADRSTSTSSFELTINSTLYRCYIKSVHGGGVAALNHLWMTDSADIPIHTASPSPSSDDDALNGLSEDAHVHVLVFASDQQTALTPTEATPLAREFLAIVSPPTITVTPASGSLEPLKSETVEVKIVLTHAPRIPARRLHILQFTNNSPSTKEIDVFLTAENYHLETEVPSIELRTFDGIDTAPFLLGLSPSFEAGTPPIAWTASSSAPWVTLSATAGFAPFDLQISLNEALLPGIPATAEILIQPSYGDPLTLPVSYELLTPEFDELIVDPNRPIVYGRRRGNSQPGDAAIATLDAYSGTISGSLSLLGTAADFDINRLADELYVADSANAFIRVIDLSAWSPDRVLTVGGTTDRVATFGQDAILYQSNENSYSMIDLNGTPRGDPLQLDSIEQIAASQTQSPFVVLVPEPDAPLQSLQRLSYGSEFIIDAAYSPIDGIVGQRPLHITNNNERIFWGNQVLDENLNLLGSLFQNVHSASPRGELVVTNTDVRSLSAAGASILTLPFSTEISAIWGDAERVIAHNNTTGETISLPLRDYSATAIDFGDVALGNSATASTTITNHGVEPLTLTGASTGGISLSPFPIIIAPGQSADFTASLTANALGTNTGSVLLIDDFIESPTRSVAFTATGTFDPDSLPGYAAWSAGDSARLDPLADPDADNLPNYAEFLFSLDPASPYNPNQHLPTIADGQLTFVRSTANTALIVVESSTDLSNWSLASGLPASTTTDLGNGMERVSYSLSATSYRFYRARAVFPIP